MRYHLRIEGKAVGASRPRVARNGGVYYPKTHVEWERTAVNLMVRNRGSWPINCPDPVVVAIEVGAKRLVQKPDLDNIAKLALDALVKAALLADDTQVVKLTIERRIVMLKASQYVDVTMYAFEPKEYNERWVSS